MKTKQKNNEIQTAEIHVYEDLICVFTFIYSKEKLLFVAFVCFGFLCDFVLIWRISMHPGVLCTGLLTQGSQIFFYRRVITENVKFIS